MEIQHYSKLKVDYAAKTRVLVKQIQDCFNLSTKDISDIMEISVNDFNFFLNKQGSIKLHSLQRLLEQFDISMDSIKEGNLDVHILSEHRKGQLDIISEKYLIGAFSKRRTIYNTLKFLKNHIGYHVYDMTERFFQLNKTILASPDEFINIHFIEDLYAYLSKYHKLTSRDFFEMGRHNLKTLQGTAFADSLCQVDHPKELYRNLVERDVKLLERNSDYYIVELTDEICILRSRAGQEVKDILSVRKVGNKETCKYREGIFSVLPEFIDLPPADVQETSCVHRGDKCCEFKIDFSKANLQHRLDNSKLLPFRRLH